MPPTALEIRQQIAASADRRRAADASRDLAIRPAATPTAAQQPAAPVAPTAASAKAGAGVPCTNCGGTGYAPASVAAEANRKSKLDAVTANDR